MRSIVYKSLFLCFFLLQPLTSWSQEVEVTVVDSQQPWVAPDITVLSDDWWTNFLSEDGNVFRSRAQILIDSVNEYIQGLDADNLVVAQTTVKTLRSNLDTALSMQSGISPLQIPTLPTFDNYTLAQNFKLKTQAREAEKHLDELKLQHKQIARQSELLRQRLDLNLVEYRNVDPSSSARLLTGLNGMNLHLEIYALQKQMAANISHQGQLQAYLDSASQKIDYAALHLVTDDLSLDNLKGNIQRLSAEVAKIISNQAAVQNQLLDAVNALPQDPFNILKLKQQLTLGSVEEVLTQLKLELEYGKHDWFLLRSGAVAEVADLHTISPLLEALVDGIDQQLVLWTDASQNTLVTPEPEVGRAAKKYYTESQVNAHKTLKLVAELETTIDNLASVSSQVDKEVLALRQDVGGLWLRIKLSSLHYLQATKSLLNFSLFHISGKPVTTGGIAKALFIFLFFWAISWVIRHFLDRLEKRQLFQQGSIYAGGRVLHYLILTIAGFSALGSLGLDFSNFALIAGALSVGIGFGLQSLVLNFVSGLVLLFEGSIRVGDYVELDSGLLGVVTNIRNRSPPLHTHATATVIVPNSELVANRMINWTLKESVARMRIPFSVAYGSDKKLVEKAALEAAAEGEFCIQHTAGRKPAVRMIDFGDSALNFELRVWVNRQGVRRPVYVKSSILLVMDDRFKAYGITVPFPQRDLHIRESDK